MRRSWSVPLPVCYALTINALLKSMSNNGVRLPSLTEGFETRTLFGVVDGTGGRCVEELAALRRRLTFHIRTS